MSQDFTSGSIPGKMAKFMLPILGALILQAMYSAVDMLIVGRFGTTAGVSGASTGASILSLVTFAVSSLTTGVTVLMGQYIGEGREEKNGSLIGNAIFFFLIAALVVTVVVEAFAYPLAIIMQTPEEAVELTVLYVRICGGGYVFIVFYNFISSIFRGMGDSRMPLIFVGIACVVNIVGDLILVAGLNMNTAGAAIATVGAQAVSVILSIVIIRRRDFAFKIRKEDLRFGPEARHFLKVGFPLALQSVLTDVSFLALCAFVNRLGLEQSAGYGIAQRIQSFVMLIPSAIMQSMAPFVAQNVGAKLEDRALKALRTGILIGSAIGVLVMVGIFFKGDALAGFFTKDTAVMEQAFAYLKGFSPEAVVTVILFSFMGYYNGHSDSLFVMIQGLMQTFLVRLPMSYIMSIQPNASLTWIGFAAPTATMFGILLNLLFFIWAKKRYFAVRAK